ncbi:MAG: hypothetical protein AMXMBFR46_02890 [Acidimicrobiia bacterium]
MSVRSSRGSALALTGVLFVVLLVIGFVIGGESPDSDAPRREVVEYWADHDDQNTIGSAIEAAAAVALLFFSATLYRSTKSWGDDGTLPAAAFAGGIVAAAGVGVDAAIRFTAADVADKIDPATLQTLSIMWADFFFPMVVGLATLILATSILGWRSRALPVWLAVVGILLTIAFFTPVGFAAFLLSAVWIIVLSVLLWRRGARAGDEAPTVAAS